MNLVNGRRSCRQTLALPVTAPWRLLIRSWWTWVLPLQTRLRSGPRGGGGGDGGLHLDLHRHLAVPFSPEATEGSCWPHLHLVKEMK